MTPLSLLVKPVSADCNLRCEYCFYCERPSDPYDFRQRHCMADDTLAAMIQQYMGTVGQFAPFAWQGGEPMLAGLPFFERVIEYQKKYGVSGQVVSNAIQTNAVLIDDAWAELFEHVDFGGRSIMLDYADRHSVVYDDLRCSEGFNDRASSVICAIPPGWRLRLHDGRDRQGAFVDFTGNGSVQRISNLHILTLSDGRQAGDRISSIEWERIR